MFGEMKVREVEWSGVKVEVEDEKKRVRVAGSRFLGLAGGNIVPIVLVYDILHLVSNYHNERSVVPDIVTPSTQYIYTKGRVLELSTTTVR